MVRKALGKFSESILSLVRTKEILHLSGRGCQVLYAFSSASHMIGDLAYYRQLEPKVCGRAAPCARQPELQASLQGSSHN